MYAEDQDESERNSKITYSIVSTDDKFSIDPETGWLSTKSVRIWDTILTKMWQKRKETLDCTANFGSQQHLWPISIVSSFHFEIGSQCHFIVKDTCWFLYHQESLNIASENWLIVVVTGFAKTKGKSPLLLCIKSMEFRCSCRRNSLSLSKQTSMATVAILKEWQNFAYCGTALARKAGREVWKSIG